MVRIIDTKSKKDQISMGVEPPLRVRLKPRYVEINQSNSFDGEWAENSVTVPLDRLPILIDRLQRINNGEAQ